VAQKIVVDPQAGRVLMMAGIEATRKVQGDQTSGGFSITEQVAQPGSFVPPHMHEKFDEVSYVLEGELGVMVGEEEFQVPTGAFVVRPKGVPHALWNIGERSTRFLDMYTPAGHEAFFEEVARMLSAVPPPPLDQVLEAGRRFDTIFLAELAPPLMAKYNLKMPGMA
jgi:mannose-6-phosphate isomerase-like protein (cupin superfamily)